MPTWVGLLRAVNVGGRNRVPMADLRRVVEALPAADVATYVQSGNVVFTASARTEARVVAALEPALADAFGFPITAIVRSAAAVAEAVAANPLPTAERDPARLHVTFLTAEPPPGAVPAGVHRVGDEEYALVGRELYTYTPAGIGRSELTRALSERRLGVAGTARNWRTVTTLAAMAAT